MLVVQRAGAALSHVVQGPGRKPKESGGFAECQIGGLDWLRRHGRASRSWTDALIVLRQTALWESRLSQSSQSPCHDEVAPTD